VSSEVIAEFSDYSSLVAALREARELRNISFDTLDHLGGLSKGHSSKILSPNGSRRVTLQSLQWLLGGLACKCLIVSDDDALRRINSRMIERDNKVVRGGAVHVVMSRRWLSEIGRKGALATNAQRIRRKEAARRAALARWRGQNE
jgi:hypothetical protein